MRRFAGVAPTETRSLRRTPLACGLWRGAPAARPLRPHSDGFARPCVGPRRPAPLGRRLEHPASGRWLEMRSSLPGVQVYTGNGLDAAAGSTAHGAVALEAQHLPDAVNQARFPSVVCRPGEPFERRIEITVGA